MKKFFKYFMILCFAVLIMGCSSSRTYSTFLPYDGSTYLGGGSYFSVKGGEKIDAKRIISNASYSFEGKDKIKLEFDVNMELFSSFYKKGTYKGTAVVLGDVNKESYEQVDSSTNKKYTNTWYSYDINVVFDNGSNREYKVTEYILGNDKHYVELTDESRFDSGWYLNLEIEE